MSLRGDLGGGLLPTHPALCGIPDGSRVIQVACLQLATEYYLRCGQPVVRVTNFGFICCPVAHGDSTGMQVTAQGLVFP